MPEPMQRAPLKAGDVAGVLRALREDFTMRSYFVTGGWVGLRADVLSVGLTGWLAGWLAGWLTQQCGVVAVGGRWLCKGGRA